MAKRNRRTAALLLLAGFSTSIGAAFGRDLAQANAYFQTGQYEQAIANYQQAANIGSAQAFYQLGQMYYQGLGVKADALQALMWFSLAAEQKFNDAETITADLLSLATEKQAPKLRAMIEKVKAEYGVDVVAHTYFPVLKTDALKQQIQFLNAQGEAVAPEFTDLNKIAIEEALIGTSLDNSEQAIQYFLNGRPGPISMENRNSFALVDYEIGRDGAIRNAEPMQVNGFITEAMSRLKTTVFAKPTFGTLPVTFYQRSYLGLSGYNSQFMRSQGAYEDFYVRIIRRVNKLRKGTSLDEQYQYAVALMTFPWLQNDDNQLSPVLNKLAEAGHPLAQYEYGLMLYRQQSDIAESVHWLSEASKSGVVKAQYLLGRLLLDSPWVERDETKGLFWLEEAGSKAYAPALLGATGLRLLAKDAALRDVALAQEYLAQIEGDDMRNPDYEYLTAIQYATQQPRQLDLAVDHLRDAISLGNTFNWDVSSWEQQLDNWTSGGKVRVIDLEDKG